MGTRRTLGKTFWRLSGVNFRREGCSTSRSLYLSPRSLILCCGAQVLSAQRRCCQATGDSQGWCGFESSGPMIRPAPDYPKAKKLRPRVCMQCVWP
jgi:hypothetical protein